MIPVTAPGVGGIDPRVLVAGAAAGVFLFLVLLFLILRHRRKKQRKEDQELFGPFEGDAFDLDSDIAERAEERAVENQIADVPVKPQDPVNQVRSFAEDNPEIIASMISTGLKAVSYTHRDVYKRQAMDSATNNAEEMIEELCLADNRARQGSITQELTEIIAGANAIS